MSAPPSSDGAREGLRGFREGVHKRPSASVPAPGRGAGPGGGDPGPGVGGRGPASVAGQSEVRARMEW